MASLLRNGAMKFKKIYHSSMPTSAIKGLDQRSSICIFKDVVQSRFHAEVTNNCFTNNFLHKELTLMWWCKLAEKFMPLTVKKLRGPRSQISGPNLLVVGHESHFCLPSPSLRFWFYFFMLHQITCTKTHFNMIF